MAETSHLPGTRLRIDDLVIEFATNRPAVSSVSLAVEHGEILALVGESGSGKSMTARAIVGLLPDGAQASGSIRLGETELLGVPEKILNEVRGRRVSMVFQEPQTALNPVKTVGWQITEALRAHHRSGGDGTRFSRKAALARAVELLRTVEIPEPEKRVGYYPHQLSGGQKQRVVLALALTHDPELLLADEPTTALDVTVQAEILALLRRLNQRTGTSILLITHNMGVVAEMADRVIVLRNGSIVESNDTEALFSDPQHPYTRRLLASVPRLPRGDESASSSEPSRETGDLVFTLDRASVVYAGRFGQDDFTAVRDVSLSVARGEVLGLVGESGSGKTTIGRVAAGLVPVADGKIVLHGDDLSTVNQARLRALRRDLAFVHQDPAASLDPLRTVGQSIREPLDVHGVGSRIERNRRIAELLDAVQLPRDFAGRLPRQLSGGQRQRVALARALALRPTLLIADEPTSALDVSVQADVLELFSALQRELGFACLFISHDLAVVHQVSDRVAVLRNGEIVESGPVGEVFAFPSHPYTRQLLDAVPVPDPTAGDRRGALASESTI